VHLGREMMLTTEFIESHRRIFVSIFFAFFLATGLLIFRDYGVHCDEYTNQQYGRGWGRYVSEFLSKGPHARIPILRNWDYTHGHTYPIILFFIEKLLKLEDSRDVLLMRHLLVFLTFYLGVFFFYSLCRHFFASWRVGLLASALLILQPRIFAHSFYNSVDIPFLSFSIISAYTLFRFLERKSWLIIPLHALAGALLMGIRMVGAIMPICTLLFAATAIIHKRKNKAEIRRAMTDILIYVTFSIVFIILLEPLLWNKPVYNLIHSLARSKFNIYRDVVPWFYNPEFILLTTPLLYSVCFLAGLFFNIKSLFKGSGNFYSRNRNVLVIGFLFFVPLIMPVVFETRLFDDWRHHYFVYPFFVIFAVAGITQLFNLVKTKFKSTLGVVTRVALILVIASSLLLTVRFMIAFHPHQCVYANSLAGRDLRYVKIDLSLDYWGLSYRSALENILNRDKKDIIRVFGDNFMAGDNAKILPRPDRERLIFVKRRAGADYFVSNFRWHRGDYPRKPEIFSLDYRGTKFMVVYELRKNKRKTLISRDGQS
jgi:hypothetical protein